MKRDAEPLPALVRGRTLASVRRDLERWRNDPARSGRIPAALWQAAAEVAREHGVSRTSRELGLDYYALERRLSSRAGPAAVPSQSGAFVEVALPGLAVAPDCRLELSDGHGTRLSIELRGAARTEVEALARVLWSAAR